MQPTNDEVRAQLERLLASDALSGSARLRRFLSFIVERALEGEGRQLKEYAVGIEVFDRGSDYDPRIDSIVRVEAGRLRARLDEYYSHAGHDDPVIVRIPRGGYTPVFERRPAPLVTSSNGSGNGPSQSGDRRVRWLAAAGTVAAAAVVVTLVQLPRIQSAGGESLRGSDRDVSAQAAQVSAVRVAVLPFAHYSNDPAVGLLAARLTDGVMSELVRTGRVHVVSRASTLQFADGPRSLKDVARALNANLVVEGSIHVDADRIRVQARMVDPDVDRKLSLHEFEGTRQNLDELQRTIAAAVDRSGAPVLPR
jgi:TolB-like protein